MTVAPERTDLSLLAQELASIFKANTQLLQRVAGRLSTGQIKLVQHKVQLDPYVGPARSQLTEIERLARGGNAAARRELRSITQYHQAGRYTPLARFLAQFPVEWRVPLLTSLRDDVITIELKAAADNRVVEALSWSDPYRFEYGLRGFMLTFAQVVEIATWMRANEDELPLTPMTMPAMVKGDQAIEGTRWAALTTFFDNFPERYRDLLAKKARPQLRGVRFEVLPTGEIKMKLTA